MLGGVLVELQRPGQSVEDLRRRVVIAALLEADEIVGAHTGERRKLLAAMARYTQGGRRPASDDVATFLDPRLRELFAWRRDVRRFRADALPVGTLERRPR